MRYLTWLIRIVLFVLVILFALKNTNPVTVTFFGKLSVKDIPLVVVILVSVFIGGVIIYLVSMPSSIRRGVEINRLRKENSNLKQTLSKIEKTEKISPMTPPDGFVANDKSN